jgi:hypothetical protein
MASNKTYSDIEAYLKTLCDEHKDVNISAEKYRFFKSQKEFIEQSGNVKDTCVVLNSLTGRNVNNHENIVCAWQLIFTVYKKLKPNDFPARSVKFDDAFNVGNDFVSRMVKDRRTLQLLYYFKADEVTWRPASETADNYVGADFTLTIYQPNNLKYRTEKWD